MLFMFHLHDNNESSFPVPHRGQNSIMHYQNIQVVGAQPDPINEKMGEKFLVVLKLPRNCHY